MLAVFKNDVMSAPKELHSPASLQAHGKAKTPDDCVELLASNSEICRQGYVGLYPNSTFGHVTSKVTLKTRAHTGLLLLCGVDDVYSMFLGSLTNLCALNKHYGLTKGGKEAMFVLKAYKTLWDRSPLPAHQVLKELEGSFGFVALGANKAVTLHWGATADGSVIISDDIGLIKASRRKSFAPFPFGCMYHSERGLINFEDPIYKMKAMPRVDSEGAMCGSYFTVDVYSKVNSKPRVGSQANWAT